MAKWAIGIIATCFGLVTTAQAQWQITSYQIPGLEISSMTIADQYFAGYRPTRFDASSNTLTRLDLWESGGDGQFTINSPIPGMDQNGGANDTNDFTARATGQLMVTAAGMYDFFTDSDDGNRFRLDINQNGFFEPTESILPDGGLQGTGTAERPGLIALGIGKYNFEVTLFEHGGGASIDAGYRVNGAGTQYVVGDAAGGIALSGPMTVRAVGAQLSPQITNFAAADALRAGVSGPGFPATELRNVFNITDSGATGTIPGDQGAPGLGVPDANDDNDFAVYGTGYIAVGPTQGGSYIFRSNTDDGGRLKIDLNGDGDFNDPGEVVINDDVLSGPHDFNSSAVTLAPGFYKTEYAWFERGGGGEGEVSAQLVGTPDFILLGDEAAGGLDVVQQVPEPTTLAVIAAFGLIGAVAVWRRRK